MLKLETCHYEDTASDLLVRVERKDEHTVWIRLEGFIGGECQVDEVFTVSAACFRVEILGTEHTDSINAEITS